MQGVAAVPFATQAVSARARRQWIAASVSIVALVAAAAMIVFRLAPEDRIIAAPMAAIAETALVFVAVLWSRDGILPLFEAGSLCMFANAVYGILPLAGFVMMHGRWDPYADLRIQAYPFIPAEIGAFGWRYELYTAAFAATYLIIRGRAVVRSTAFRLPKANTHVAVAIVFVALYACKIALRIRYGYDPESVSYADLAGALASMRSKPLWVLQIGHNVISAFGVVQSAMLVLLIARWRKWWARYAVVLWVAAEVASVAVRLGSRSGAVLLLISAGVLYHRLVKPLSLRLSIIAGVLLLTAFLAVGLLRDRSGASLERPQSAITAANEFQVLFTTAFDIHQRSEAGQIADIPWQLYFSDLYFLIPSQLLPFQKIDPTIWYLQLIGVADSGVGFMFGVMSQAVLGLDWIELFLRGAALAAFLAFLHRWYVRNAAGFWPTVFYLFIGIWTYLTFRATSFYFVYLIVYHFIPVLLVTKFLEAILNPARRVRVTGSAAGEGERPFTP